MCLILNLRPSKRLLDLLSVLKLAKKDIVTLSAIEGKAIKLLLGSLSNHDDGGNKNPTNLHI